MEMNDYQKLVKEISTQTIKQQSKEKLKQYLVNNWIAIVALVISIIALLKP